MKDILILGAGVTGLSMGQLLNGKSNVTILEKEGQIGGIAKTRQVNGVTYHTVGGHCFNSKYEDVMSFVFNLLPQKEWHKVKRFSSINLDEYEVDYPIEYSVHQIYKHDPDLAFAITRDFLSSYDDGSYSNLEEWFRKKFGDRLCELYFLPYNTKIWGRNPNLMSHEWVQDKLPIPDKKSFFSSLMQPCTDSMPHSQFYYPGSNNQMSLIEALANGINIICNEPVSRIGKRGGRWLVNGKYEADLIISTLPLNLLPSYIEGTPQYVLEKAKLLKYNKVSNILWESAPTHKTWSYQPLPDSIFHRYIHIGNFFNPVKNYTITECVGEKSYDEMVKCGKRDSFLIRPLDYNVSDHAYVVFDENCDKAVGAILDYLYGVDIISIGRFGQWEYFNMDVCMKQSLDTYIKIKERL